MLGNDNKFNTLYEKVFDKNGNIKKCGRNACIELIDYVESTFNVEVGREEHGLIENKDLIKELYLNHKS